MSNSTDRPESNKEETIFMSLDVSPDPIPQIPVSAEPSEGRNEVSAAAIARIMGVATSDEIRFVESKVELLNSKLTAMQLKLEKILQGINAMPSGVDLERIDVQIGALRQLIREVLAKNIGDGEASPATPAKSKTKSSEK